MTFATILPFALAFVCVLLGILLVISFRKKKKQYIFMLIPCIILVGISMILSFANSTEGHIQNFKAYPIDNLSITNELLDQSLLEELNTETDSVSQEMINNTQISNFDVIVGV